MSTFTPEETQLAQGHRVVGLLDALARSGVVPSPARALHELAYLANVLSPVFDLQPFDAALLKRSAGPYYPGLQAALDHLVGRGLVDALDLTYEIDDTDGRYRVHARYRLRRLAADPVLDALRQFRRDETHFLSELAAAYAGLSDEAMGVATQWDARYADADVDVNDVIDFGEWASSAKNFSRNAAMAFAPERTLMPAERLYLYLDYLGQKAQAYG
ncbi:hypothetical protein [Arenimonas terrae]|uniref:Uncharacterized protein n=1 Tax=Arenimonas terrae TaxID=2546226 RepID=A0A5C4RTK9_9GAMM|nr:hypothetical protein [Arenimonas terrae]TNJ34292.1 hypothetical protein E1B00_00415 [Arenimonas terrae]